MKFDGELGLVGFGDFEGFADDDYYQGGRHEEIGATPRPVLSRAPRPAPAKKPAKAQDKHKGSVQAVKAPPSKNQSPHKLALTNAAKASKQAVDVKKHIAQLTAQYKNRVASRMHVPVVPASGLATGMVKHTVNLSLAGRGTHVGAAAKPIQVVAKLTPRQQAAVNRHALTTKLLAKAKKNAAIAAAKAGHTGTTGLSFVKTAVPAVKKALVIQGFRGAKPTTIHGIVGEYIDSVGGVEHLSDDEVIALGQALTAMPSTPPAPATPTPSDSTSNPPDPSNPGYLMDGSPDPNAVAADAALPTDQSSSTDSTTGVVTDPDGNVLYDPATDQEVVPMPQHGQDLTQDELRQVWDTVPDDGFVYQEGAQVYPVNAVGSWSTFFGPQWKSGWGRGYIYGLHNSWMFPQDDQFVDGTFGNTSEIQKYSVQQNGWGPLIGNPNGPLKNLQYAQKDQKWFWQSKAVDPAMAADADAKIASANQATIAANRASAVAVAKQMYADKMQAAEQKAQQDAANALAESQATSQANVAQTQAQADQAGVETQAQQALVQQQAADTAQQQAETESEAAAAAELIAQAKLQRENPERYEQIYGPPAGYDEDQGDQGDDLDQAPSDDDYPDISDGMTMADGLPPPGFEGTDGTIGNINEMNGIVAEEDF